MSSSSNLTSIYGGNETLIEDPSLCTLQTCDLTLAVFNYDPTLAGNVLYCAIFGVIILAQLVLGFKYRTWGFTAAMVSGLLLEIIGYAARIMISENPFDENGFLTYLVCLTIAPAFLAAGSYLCLSRIVVVYGESLSRFRPRTYTILFCSCDFFSLLLQAIGGAIADTASTQNMVNAGINIMLAGLSFQVFSLLLFACLCADFAWRVRNNRSSWDSNKNRVYDSKRWPWFLAALAASVVCIFIRSVYRVAELQGGFNGALANNEVLFMIFEGVMIIIATSVLTVLHPGICFKGVWAEANFSMRRGGKRSNIRSLSSSTGGDSEGAYALAESKARQQK